jgi:hypothetical protein
MSLVRSELYNSSTQSWIRTDKWNKYYGSGFYNTELHLSFEIKYHSKWRFRKPILRSLS